MDTHAGKAGRIRPPLHTIESLKPFWCPQQRFDVVQPSADFCWCCSWWRIWAV